MRWKRSLTEQKHVFLVHGHNEAAIHETATVLERLGLRVTILREQPNSGRTIIDKFVDRSDVAFAVILLTGDDRGGSSAVPAEEQKLRARQNVILELGFFLGKLGRKQESTAGTLRGQIARCENIAAELHTFFWAASTGADFSRIRTIQYVPVRIYVGDTVPGQDALTGMIQAIERLGGALALERAEEFPEETGSCWKKLVLRTKNVATHE